MAWTPRRVEDDVIDAGNMQWRDGEDDGLLPAGLNAVFCLRPGAFRAINTASTSEPKGAPAPAPPKEDKPADPPPADPPKEGGAGQAVDGAAALGKDDGPKPSPAAADNADAKKPEPAPAPAPEAPKDDAPKPSPAAADDADAKKSEPAPAPEAPKDAGPKPSPAAADNADAKKSEPAAPAPDDAPSASAPKTSPTAVDHADAKASDPAPADGDGPNATQTKPGANAPAPTVRDGKDGAAGRPLAAADADATAALDEARAETTRNFLASSSKPDAGTDADSDATDEAEADAADRVTADREAQRARNQVDAAAGAPAPAPADDTPPVNVDGQTAAELDAIAEEERAQAQADQQAYQAQLDEVQPDKPAEDAAEADRVAYEQQVQEAAAETQRINEQYFGEQGTNVFIEPDGTVYHASYQDGQLVKTRLDAPVPVGAGQGSSDTTIVVPDAGGETFTNIVTPPANADGTVPPPIKATVETAPAGDVEKAWVEGADDDAAKLDAVLPADRRQQVADAQPPLDASKEERSAWYDDVNVNVDPATGKVSGAGLNHDTGELTLNRNADRVETAPGVFASRDTSTKVDLAGTKALTGTTTALDPAGAKVGDPIRDEITTQADGAITKSMVTVLGGDGQPKRDGQGVPIPPTAEQLDTVVAPETLAAVTEAQRQHTETVDALRGELPNPSTEEERAAYMERIAQNDEAIQAELARYYATNNLYVLDGQTMNATYDAASGELRLQRPGLRTEFNGGGATENYRMTIEVNGARREGREIAQDAKDGQPAPPLTTFSTERTFSGELKGAHLTQHDAQGVPQPHDDGAMLDELLTPALRQELLQTQVRDDVAVTQLRGAASGTGPEADAARARIGQLMDERGVHVDLDGTAYGASWNNDSQELAIARSVRPAVAAGQPPVEHSVDAILRTDGSRHTETKVATIPTGAPGEVSESKTDIVETNAEFDITSSQVVQDKRRRNGDGSADVEASTTDFNDRGIPTKSVTDSFSDGPDGVRLASKDMSSTTMLFDANGDPTEAGTHTEYGHGPDAQDEKVVEDSKTTFAPGGIPQLTSTTKTTGVVEYDKDVDSTHIVEKTDLEYDASGLPASTYVYREGDYDALLPGEEVTLWNPDGTPKQRIVAGDTAGGLGKDYMVRRAESGQLPTVRADQVEGLGHQVSILDPTTPVPDGHRIATDWTRGADGRWTNEATDPKLGPTLLPSITTPSAFEMPAQLKAGSVAATLDADGPHAGTPEFDALVADQATYEQQMDAAPSDADRARIQAEYFESHDVWVDPGTGDQPPVLMAAAYTQGVPQSTMFGADRAKDPHAVLARSGIQGATPEGAQTTTDYLRNLYADNTRDDIYRTVTTAAGTTPVTAVVGERRNAQDVLEHRQTNTSQRVVRAAEGKEPIDTQSQTDETFDVASIDPATGEPFLLSRRESTAKSDSQVTALTERSDTFAGGKLTDTKTLDATQSRDFDQGRVDEFLAGQRDAMFDASHGDFNTGDHVDMAVPAAGSYRSATSTDVDYDANGVAIFSQSDQTEVSVHPTQDVDDEGNVTGNDPDGVNVITNEQQTTYGTRGGTAPIFDDAGTPLAPGRFEKTISTSEFDPNDGAAGGNKDADFQSRELTELSSSGAINPDGTPADVRYTPKLVESVKEGHDDDSIYVRQLYATDPATGQMRIEDGKPVKLAYGDQVFDRHGVEHTLGDTGNEPIDIPLGTNPESFDWNGTKTRGETIADGEFGNVDHRDQDAVDEVEDFMDEVGSKALMVGGIALAVGGVVAAPFSGGLSLGLTVAGIGMAATDFGYQAWNYRQGDIDGGDLAWSGAGLGLSIIPGAKILSSTARTGQLALRGGTAAANSTSRLAGTTFGQTGNRLGQQLDNALLPGVERGLNSAFAAHPGMARALSATDRLLPNGLLNPAWAQAGMNAPMTINGASQLNESLERDGWTFDNVLAATNLALGVGAPVATAGHLRLYRDPSNPNSTTTTLAPRDPRVSGTADPNVFAPGFGPDLTPAPIGPDGVPIITDATAPQGTPEAPDAPAIAAPQRALGGADDAPIIIDQPALEAAPAPTEGTLVGGVRGGGDVSTEAVPVATVPTEGIVAPAAVPASFDAPTRSNPRGDGMSDTEVWGSAGALRRHVDAHVGEFVPARFEAVGLEAPRTASGRVVQDAPSYLERARDYRAMALSGTLEPGVTAYARAHGGVMLVNARTNEVAMVNADGSVGSLHTKFNTGRRADGTYKRSGDPATALDKFVQRELGQDAAYRAAQAAQARGDHAGMEAAVSQLRAFSPNNPARVGAFIRNERPGGIGTHANLPARIAAQPAVPRTDAVAPAPEPIVAAAAPVEAAPVVGAAGRYGVLSGGRAGINAVSELVNGARSSVNGNVFTLGGDVRTALNAASQRLGSGVRLTLDPERVALGQLGRSGDFAGADIGTYRATGDGALPEALVLDPQDRTVFHDSDVVAAYDAAAALPKAQRSTQQQELVKQFQRFQSDVADARGAQVRTVDQQRLVDGMATYEARRVHPSQRTAEQQQLATQGELLEQRVAEAKAKAWGEQTNNDRILLQTDHSFDTGVALPITVSRPKVHAKVVTADGERAVISTAAFLDASKSRNELTFQVNDRDAVGALDNWLDASRSGDAQRVGDAAAKLAEHDIYVNDPLTDRGIRPLTERVTQLVDDVQPGETIRVASKAFEDKGTVRAALDRAVARGAKLDVVPADVASRLNLHANAIITPRGAYAGTAYVGKKTFDGGNHGRQSQEIGIVTNDAAQVQRLGGWFDDLGVQAAFQQRIANAAKAAQARNDGSHTPLVKAAATARQFPVDALAAGRATVARATALRTAMAADPTTLQRAGFTADEVARIGKLVTASATPEGAFTYGSKLANVANRVDARTALDGYAQRNPQAVESIDRAWSTKLARGADVGAELRLSDARQRQATALKQQVLQDPSVAMRLGLTPQDRFWISQVATDRGASLAFGDWFDAQVAPRLA